MKKSYKYCFLLTSVLLLFSSCNKGEKSNYFDLGDKTQKIIKNENALLFFNEGKEYLNDSKYDSAIVNYKKSLSLEKNTLTYNQIGVCESLMNNIDSSIEFHKLGIIADSTYFVNYINISKCYIAKKELNTAEKYLLKSIKNDKTEYSNAVSNLYLTIIYFNQKRDCAEIKNQFHKAKILENDDYLGGFYELVKNKINKGCDE